MTPTHALLLSATLACALETACAMTVPSYEDARDDWTESDEVYEAFVGQIFIHATLKTEAFRREYVKEYARIFSLNAEQQAALLEAEMRAAGEGRIAVVVALYTREVNWDDLRPDRGIWAVKLVGPEGVETPVREAIKRDLRNPTWRALYPATDYHYSLWELTFDAELPDGRSVGRAGEPLELVISGAPGQARVSWTLPQETGSPGPAQIPEEPDQP